MKPARLLLHAALLLSCLHLSTGLQAPAVAAEPFVGSTECGGCHEAEYRAWQGSHHDLAMQQASASTVLGDFDGAEFTVGGITSTFFRDGDRFMVRTDGPEGDLEEFSIAYTFGVDPLQQYLVEFPDGRLQALSIAWDSRAAEAGGQRWFHLYPGEVVDHEHPLHWTGVQQNWNYMCADCHSTGLVKGYDPDSDTFRTRWAEIDVGCEACHGPGQAHAEWARAAMPNDGGENGLALLLHDRRDVSWPIDAASGVAQRQGPPIEGREIGVCAACHSRRGQLAEGVETSAEFLDHYMPAFLTGDLYFDDGQIDEEVYVWGSFLQSRMHAAGVTCSDCHDPHSQQLRATGDAVCAQCHQPARFATPAHTHHEPDAGGADCLGCHMPERTYMVVDPRRDHSLRIPRPDLSLTHGTPNACTQCHTDRNDAWAAEALARWYAEPGDTFQDWTEAFQLARNGQPRAEVSLLGVIEDGTTPDIARATAVLELRDFLSPRSAQVLRAAVSDVSALVRIAALRTLDVLPPDQRFAWAGFLLNDPLLAVRVEAARLLAPVPTAALSDRQRGALQAALREYVAVQTYNADRADAQLNLGILYTGQGDAVRAEKHYRTALRRDPRFAPAYINLADLYREQGLGREAEKLLREGLEKQPDNAPLHHALGLALVRAQRMAEALAELHTAARLAPENARYGYVYGVALNSTDQAEAAVAEMTAVHQRHPADRAVLAALVNFNADMGRLPQAVEYAEKLLALNPADQRAADLLRQLQARQAGAAD